MNYLDDIESDLSRFHRIDDMEAMDSKKFLRFASRLFAYEGVMFARYMEETDGGKEQDTKQITTEYERRKLYKESGVKQDKVKAKGPDYLKNKLEGPTL